MTILDTLDADRLAAVTALLGDAEAADGVAALNEQAVLGLSAGAVASTTRHLLGTSGDGLAGYLHLDLAERDGGATAEAVVHPRHRRHGWGESLVRAALETAAPNPVLLWSHGDHPGAARLAGRLGFERVRDLWQMRRPLGAAAAADPLPPVELPAGTSIRTFSVGSDEQAWLDLNARAFASHPEQGGVTADDLARREAADWFDPAGFFLAEQGNRLVGFHWTKVHRGPPAVGEVYVVGVDPGAQGGGLGRALTLTGLHHLEDQGLGEVLLYVEADNLAARAVYERLGFAHTGTDVRYRHPGQGARAAGAR